MTTWATWMPIEASGFAYRLEDFRRLRDLLLAEASHWRAVAGEVGYIGDLVPLLVAFGADVVRDELRPVLPRVRLALEAMAAHEEAPSFPDLFLDLCAVVNTAECVGADVEASLLDLAKPFLVRLNVGPRDEYQYRYWNRGLIALAVRDRTTWQQSAGLDPGEAPGFTPRASFGFSMQGLTRHLAGAIEAQAAMADVYPAWLDFLRGAPLALRVDASHRIDAATLLWVARLVLHDIGGAPLSSVGDFLRDHVRAAAAASAEGGSSAVEDSAPDPGGPRFLR